MVSGQTKIWRGMKVPGRIGLMVGLVSLAALAACAAALPAPVTLSAPLTPVPTTATVAAVRPVSVAPSDGGSLGVNAVLNALNQPALRAPAAASEVVFVKRDGNAASLVTPADNLAAGAHVAVITAASTSLVLQN